MGKRAMGGYFRSALHVSRREALRERLVGWDDLFFPAVLVKVSDNPTVWIMWCQAIVILRRPGWYVHDSRVLVWPENRVFDQLLLQDDPRARTDAA